MAPRRILIIKSGGLGDTLLLWPAVQAVRRRLPEATLDLLGYAERCRLLVGAGGADRAWESEGSGLHLLYEPQARPPERVREFFGSYDVVVVFAAAGDYSLAENLAGCGAGEVHAFLPVPAAEERRHVAQHLLACLHEAGLADGGAEVDPLPLDEKFLDYGRQQVRAVAAGQELVLLAPGSGSPTKNWPARGWAELAERLWRTGRPAALLQGPADGPVVERVRERLGSAARRLPVLEPPSPQHLGGLLAATTLFAGNDSGPAHLAALLQRPTLVIFGPSDPWRWAPLGKSVRIVYRDCDCAPCGEDTRRNCPRRECLEQLGVERVWQALEELSAAGHGALESRGSRG